ncbi:hypothetical protein AAHE18_13G117200 [Arachis hypogaea]
MRERERQCIYRIVIGMSLYSISNHFVFIPLLFVYISHIQLEYDNINLFICLCIIIYGRIRHLCWTTYIVMFTTKYSILINIYILIPTTASLLQAMESKSLQFTGYNPNSNKNQR